MIRVDECWKAAVRVTTVLERVEQRLVDAGAVTELRQFYGLSAQEMDVLVQQELGGCASGCPQGSGAEVAA